MIGFRTMLDVVNECGNHLLDEESLEVGSKIGQYTEESDAAPVLVDKFEELFHVTVNDYKMVERGS